MSVWIAPRDISPAADWAEEIIEAISGARLMVLVFSAHSNASPQVRREVERAVHKELPVLPFRIEDVVPSKSLEYFLSSQHWLDAFPPPLEPHYEQVCAHVAALLGSAPAAECRARKVTRTAAPRRPPQPWPRSHTGPSSCSRWSGSWRSTSVRWPSTWCGARPRAVRLGATGDQLADEIESTPARKQFLDACHAIGRQSP